jgi:hypothetical protein
VNNGTIYQAIIQTTPGVFNISEFQNITEADFTDYALKTNVIELDNKNIKTLADNFNFLNILETSIYITQNTLGVYGLSEIYPYPNKGFLEIFKRESDNETLFRYTPINSLDKFYLRKKSDSVWTQFTSNISSTTTASNGLTIVGGNDIQDGGDFNVILKEGNVYHLTATSTIGMQAPIVDFTASLFDISAPNYNLGSGGTNNIIATPTSITLSANDLQLTSYNNTNITGTVTANDKLSYNSDVFAVSISDLDIPSWAKVQSAITDSMSGLPVQNGLEIVNDYLDVPWVELGGVLIKDTIFTSDGSKSIVFGLNETSENLANTVFNTSSYQINSLTSFDGTGRGTNVNINAGEFSVTNYVSTESYTQVSSGSSQAALYYFDNRSIRLMVATGGIGSGETFTINGVTFTEGVDFTGQNDNSLDATTLAGLDYSSVPYFLSVENNGESYGYFRLTFVFTSISTTFSETTQNCYFIGNNMGGKVAVNMGGSSLEYGTTTNTTSLNINSNSTTFTDSTDNQAGIEYVDDYSATFTDRSLVDKEYVDTQIITSNDYADSKIEDVIINGVTDKAPSQNIVFDALTLKEDISNKATDFTISNNILFPTTLAVHSYVGQLINGLSWKFSVTCSTAVALPTYTVSGDKLTLTSTTNGALPLIDGYDTSVSDGITVRILVKNESTTNNNNGIYNITQQGSVSTPWILTRSSDADTTLELSSATVYVRNGSTESNRVYTFQVGDNTQTIGSTTYILSLVNAANTYTNGSGLDLIGNVFSITTGGVTNTMLAGSISDSNILSATNWNTAYTNRITSLTTTGSSGSSTLISNTLNIPTYTLTGLGGQPILSGSGIVYSTAGTISYISGTSSQFIKGDGSLDSNTYALASSLTGYVDTTTTQSIGGLKTFTSDLTISSNIIYTATTNNSLSGSNERIPSHTLPVIKFTNAGLISLASANNGGVVDGHVLTISNNTGNNISIINNYVSAASGEALFTGTGANIILLNNSELTLQWNSTSNAWLVTSGGLAINGTGFVKASGTTISYDNSTYQPVYIIPNYFKVNLNTGNDATGVAGRIDKPYLTLQAVWDLIPTSNTARYTIDIEGDYTFTTGAISTSVAKDNIVFNFLGKIVYAVPATTTSKPLFYFSGVCRGLVFNVPHYTETTQGGFIFDFHTAGTVFNFGFCSLIPGISTTTVNNHGFRSIVTGTYGTNECWFNANMLIISITNDVSGILASSNYFQLNTCNYTIKNLKITGTPTVASTVVSLFVGGVRRLNIENINNDNGYTNLSQFNITFGLTSTVMDSITIDNMVISSNGSTQKSTLFTNFSGIFKNLTIKNANILNYSQIWDTNNNTQINLGWISTNGILNTVSGTASMIINFNNGNITKSVASQDTFPFLALTQGCIVNGNGNVMRGQDATYLGSSCYILLNTGANQKTIYLNNLTIYNSAINSSTSQAFVPIMYQGADTNNVVRFRNLVVSTSVDTNSHANTSFMRPVAENTSLLFRAEGNVATNYLKNVTGLTNDCDIDLINGYIV